MNVKKGDNIILTCGEYSDYSILDGLVAIVDFNTDVIVNLFLDAHPKQADVGEFETDDFDKWLISHNVARRLSLTEWNVSTYDCVSTKLSPKHQAYRDKCIKERKDKADADYAAHPENYASTSVDIVVSVNDGPRKDNDESS